MMTDHKAHPWHGITPLLDKKDEVRAFIEIVPTDTVKYEVDKSSGYLSLDRPQKFSNIVPSLYGFIPQTLCGPKMAQLANDVLARYNIEGDGDPLDICVLTEKDVTHGDIIVKARPIGGLRLLDHYQSDDKIIAVLENDALYGEMKDIEEAVRSAECKEAYPFEFDVEQFKLDFATLMTMLEEASAKAEEVESEDEREVITETKESTWRKMRRFITSRYVGYAGSAAAAAAITFVSTAMVCGIRK